MLTDQLLENEKIIFKTRFSAVVLVPKFFESILIGIFGAVLGAGVSVFAGKNILIFAPVAAAVFFIFTFFYFFKIWQKDVLFLTTRRLIFDHQKSLVSGKRVEIRLKNISEVVLLRKSFVNSLLRFGSILISPVSGTQKFKIIFLPAPKKTANLITKTIDKNFFQDEKSDPIEVLQNAEGVLEFFELTGAQKSEIKKMHSDENRGIFEILARPRVFAVLRDRKILIPQTAIAQLPNLSAHDFLQKNFSATASENGILLVGFS